MGKSAAVIAAEREEPIWYTPFLMSLTKWGNVSEACDAAGIGRSIAYDHRQTDKSFRDRWLEAIDQAVDRLRKTAWARATSKSNPSDTLLIFLLKAHDPMYRQANANMNVHTGPTYIFQLDGAEYQVSSREELEALPTEVLEKLAKGDYEAKDYEVR